jgi:hypothetical protein
MEVESSNFRISNNNKNYDPKISNYVGEHLTESQNSRVLTGDHWDIFGPLQLTFMKSIGLKKHHKLIDVGCGCFRGGIYFGEYLNKNNYYGLDINKHFIINGYENEIIPLNLSSKIPKKNILITDHYDVPVFNTTFDYAWSLSLWTHLPFDECEKCLIKIMETMKSGGMYYTTFFLVEDSEYADIIGRISELPEDMGKLTIPTHPDKDPYHMTLTQIKQLAKTVNADCSIIRWNEWNMLRKHDIAVFKKK